MKTSSCKAKGRRAAIELKTALVISSQLHPDNFIITSSGDTGEDLKLSPAARAVFPFTFECKNVEKLNFWDAIRQAEQHAEGTPYIPIVAFKRNNQPLRVVLALDAFLSLLKGRNDKA